MSISPRAVLAQGGEDVAKIKDNLFLLEEAYNQEPGVIQHIQLLQMGSGGWLYAFAEEWPAPSELHQLSLSFTAMHQDGGDAVEIGDLLVNYRLQALGLGGEGSVAMAPRVSVVVPTGDYQTGAGRGALGFQFNLPVSIDLHRYWVTHLNAGFTVTPGARSVSGDRETTFDTTGGAALVFLPVTWANALVELVHTTSEAVVPGGGKARGSAFIVNPGLRFAIDFDSGLQIVPGICAPIEIADGQTEVSGFGYLSFEHALWDASN